MPMVPNIETKRFVLRQLVRPDADPLFPTFSNPEHCRFMSQPHFETLDALADWLTDSDWPGMSWVAQDRRDGSIVGRYVAFPGRDEGVLELGYLTVAERQGQGVGAECMAALVDHLFRSGTFRKLYVEIDAENEASVALIRRLGFKLEGCLREHETTHKGLCDMMIFGLLRRESDVLFHSRAG